MLMDLRDTDAQEETKTDDKGRKDDGRKSRALKEARIALQKAAGIAPDDEDKRS